MKRKRSACIYRNSDGIPTDKTSSSEFPRNFVKSPNGSPTAIIFPRNSSHHTEHYRNGAEQAGVKYSDFSELCENGDAVNEVQQSLTKAAKLENKDKVIAGAMDIRVGTSTAALKIKREKIKAKFKDELHKQ
ncbi:hypothetical protein YC2023_048887 [Brassica napus]